MKVVICGATACAGVPIPERSRDPVSFADMRPGYYSVRERLADYKRPRGIEFVAELPKTATGKLQRSKLRQ